VVVGWIGLEVRIAGCTCVLKNFRAERGKVAARHIGRLIVCQLPGKGVRSHLSLGAMKKDFNGAELRRDETHEDESLTL